MKKALVTGASGFVGNHLTKSLISDGWHVRTISRKPIADAPDHHCMDLTKSMPCKSLVADIDCIIHLAAWQPGQGDANLAQSLNTDATRKLGELAAGAGCTSFVFVSSTAAMGNVGSSLINEDSPCSPVSVYETTKRNGELELLNLHHEYGLPVTILRPPMIVGAGLESGPILKMARLCQNRRFPIFGGRRQMAKPLIHVADLVTGITLAANKPDCCGTFLITSGAHHELGEIITAVEQLLGKQRTTLEFPLFAARLAAVLSVPLFKIIGWESPLSPARLDLFMADRRFDISKAKIELGYSPILTNTIEILRPAIEHFRQRGLI